MSAKRFVIELDGSSPRLRRMIDGLDLAAGLAAFDHTVTLVLSIRAMSRLAATLDDPEVTERLELLHDTGVAAVCSTDMPEPPAPLGPLAVAAHGAVEAHRAADAVIRL